MLFLRGFVCVLGVLGVSAPGRGADEPKPADPKPRPVRVTAILGKHLAPSEMITYKTMENGKLPLTLAVFKPSGWKAADRRPVLVTFHGGGWAAGDPTTQYYIADRLAKAGWVGISVKYRLTNSKHPGTTVFDAVKDARSAIRYVRAHASELGIDPQRLVTNGGSAGGHLAAATALFPDVNDEADDLKISAVPQAMILMYPVIDTGEKGYGFALIGEKWKTLSPVDRVVPGLPPTLLMHGDRDTVTPYAGAKLFHERMIAAGNSCELITGKGPHGYFTYQQEPYDHAMKQVDAWLKAHDYPTEPISLDSPVVRSDVYTRGTDGYHTYRIPAMLQTRKGTLLAFCEGRKTSGADHGDIDLVLRRSVDGGRTWLPLQIVHEEGGEAKITIGNPCPVEDRTTGVVWLAFCQDNKKVFITRSIDDGVTWDKPIEISDSVTKPDWYWVATGPGHGIQLKTGRLLIPTDCQVRGEKKSRHSFAIYSDDHGKTWQAGSVTGDGMNECQAVEKADGSVLLTMRNYLGQGKRAFASSTDGGLTWTEPRLHDKVPCPVCEASVLRYSLATAAGGKDRILYSGPAEPKRRSLTVRLSYDEGKTWPVSRVLHEGNGEYSDLVMLPGGEIGCFYERDGYRQLSFARFNLHWLTSGKDRLSQAADTKEAETGPVPVINASPDARYYDAKRQFQGIPTIERAKNGRLWADGKTWVGGFMLDERKDVSYPDGVEGSDGTIYILYDRERKGAKEVLLATFHEDDIRARKPVSGKVQLRQVINQAGAMGIPK